MLFRPDQVAALEALALESGVDYSDAVRLAVDRLLAETAFARRCRRFASLELCLRRLDAVPDLLCELVVTGWEGKAVTVPIEAQLKPPAVKLVRRSVHLLAALELVPPSRRPAPARRDPPCSRPEFPDTWATALPGDLLGVLASPAVRAVGEGQSADEPRPAGVVVPASVFPPDGPGEPPEQPEPHLARVAAALAALEAGRFVERVRVSGSDVAREVGAGTFFRVRWRLIEQERR